MKKSELEKKMKTYGWYFSAEGKKHEKWENGLGEWIMIPRHPKIQEGTAKSIIKKAQKNPSK